MSEILERTWAFLTSSGTGPRWSVPAHQPSPVAHLPHGLAQFIRTVFDAPTSSAEAKVVRDQMKAINAKLKEPGLRTAVLADCVARAMLGHIMGHNVEFAHIHALQLAQKGSITEKKLGYLACTLFLGESDDINLLVVNTIIKDLNSLNVVDNNIALVAAAYLIPREMAPMMVPVLTEKLGHSRDFIRKKALVGLEQIALKCGQDDTIDEISSHVIRTFADADPGVVSVAIQIVDRFVGEKFIDDCESFEAISGAVCDVQEQILAGYLHEDYLANNLAAPFTQLCILRLLRKIGANLPTKSDVANLIVNTLSQNNIKESSIGLAIIYECVETTASILPTDMDVQSTFWPKVIQKVLKKWTWLAGTESNDGKYLALCCMETLAARTEGRFSTNNENNFVMDCINSEDDCVRNKAFSVLHTLANKENAKEVAEKLIGHVKVVDDARARSDLINRVVLIMDKFEACTTVDWRAFSLLRLIQCANDDHQRSNLTACMKKLLSESSRIADNFHIGNKLLRVLAKPAGDSQAPTTLVVLYIWCLGHFSTDMSLCIEEIITLMQAKTDRGVIKAGLDSIFAVLVKLLSTSNCSSEGVKDRISTGGAKSLSNTMENVREIFPDDLLLHDLARENLALIEFVVDNDVVVGSAESAFCDFTMSHLDQFVVESLENGAAPYTPGKFSPHNNDLIKSLRGPSLKLTPYNTMDESEWISAGIASPTSSEETSKSTPKEVWTLEGRVKPDNTDSEQLVEESMVSCDKTNDFEESVIQDLSNWKT